VRNKKIAEKLREFERLCHDRSLSVTLQRRTILETVLGRNDHPAVDQIFEDVRDRIPAVSRTTVYRVLETLVEMQMVQQLSHPGRALRFDGRTDRHHHAVCQCCGRIIDVEDSRCSRLPRLKGELRGFRVDEYSIVFLGTCSDCLKEQSELDSGEGE